MYVPIWLWKLVLVGSTGSVPPTPGHGRARQVSSHRVAHCSAPLAQAAPRVSPGLEQTGSGQYAARPDWNRASPGVQQGLEVSDLAKLGWISPESFRHLCRAPLCSLGIFRSHISNLPYPEEWRVNGTVHPAALVASEY